MSVMQIWKNVGIGSDGVGEERQHTMIYGWHFLNDGEAHGGYKPPTDGSMEKIDGNPVVCRHGFHASRQPLDALNYAHGAIVRRVVLSGKIEEGDDKLVATQRRELWRADATITLHKFAVWCANQALQNERKAGREPDMRSWAAIQAAANSLSVILPSSQSSLACIAAHERMSGSRPAFRSFCSA